MVESTAASTKTSSDIIPVPVQVCMVFAFPFAAVTMDGASKAAHADCSTTSGRSYSKQSIPSATRGKQTSPGGPSDSTRPVGVQAHSGRRWTEHLMLPSYALINVSLDHRLIACVNQCTPKKRTRHQKKKVRFKSLPPRTTPNTQRNFPSPRLPPTMFWRPQAARTPESACASDLQHQPRAALQHRLAL